MSDKERRKKGGERKDKKQERMREAVHERHAAPHDGQLHSKDVGTHSDQDDIYPKVNPEMIDPGKPSAMGNG